MARRAAPIPSVGDTAIIESYVRHAADGVVLVGPYSRFQWHHPGPLLFYVLAPFYALSGSRTAGLSAGAAVINLLTAGGLIWAVRRLGGVLALVAMAATAFYVVRISGVLASPWNPHVLVLPLQLFLLVAALAAISPSALPIVALLGSFIVQTHVGAAPTVLTIAAFSVAASGYEARASNCAAGWPHFLKCAGVTAGLTLVLWALPLVEELTRSPGNLTRLWMFFANRSSLSQSFDAALNAWAGALTGFVRPAFEAAWGGGGPLPVTRFVEILAASEIVLLGVAAVYAWRRGDRAACALPAVLLLAALAALWSVTRIEGEIIDHEVFWLSAIGPLTLAVLVDAAFRFVLQRPQWTPAPAFINGSCALAAVVVATLTFVEFRRSIVNPHGSEREEAAVETLSVGIEHVVDSSPAHTVLLDMDGPSWGVAAGLIVRLEASGIHASVGPGAVWMFGEWTMPTGREGQRVAISGEDRHRDMASVPGTRLLASGGGFYADLLPPESAPRR